jgi:broad specificity phosphatase PhoE
MLRLYPKLPLIEGFSRPNWELPKFFGQVLKRIWFVRLFEKRKPGIPYYRHEKRKQDLAMGSVYIVRHGDKAQGDFYNPRLRLQDMPISEKGQQEARNLCSFFADKPAAAIYVSEYQRTGQTIAYVAQQKGITPVVDERLNEIDNGGIDRWSDEEIQTRFADFWRAYHEQTADFRFPDGEMGGEAQGRIVSILEEKRRLHGDDSFILVCHDGLIRLLMCHVVHLPVYKRWNFRVDTCGIMEIKYIPEFNEWQLIRFNQKMD